MIKTAKTLDDLMRFVLTKLLVVPVSNKSVRRGKSSEIIGVLLKLKNPRARLSNTETKGKPFSAIGELLWYLKKTNKLEFIIYYINAYKKESEDGKTIYGAYGPRLFKHRGLNQVENVITLLKKNPSSRRAVIQLFGAEDIVNPDRQEIPCTCTLQFLVRNSKLQLIVSMRSNDAFYGLPHDVFAFTMLQEIVARSLSLELGEYQHFVGSMHLYESKFDEAQRYIAEGWQKTSHEMPRMPNGDPWKSIKRVLEIESKIRKGATIDYSKIKLDPYWLDLSRMVQIYTSLKNRKIGMVKKMKEGMTTNFYNPYIDKRLRTTSKAAN